jgi:crossover junction endodeoxyribonuclease RusA
VTTTLRAWTIPLPYTTPPLSLNSRAHWAPTARVVREVQHAAWVLAKHHKLPRLDRITVELVYWPGTNRVHDSDNMGATIKALLDGLRKAGVVPDDRGRHVRSSICTVIERDEDPEGRTDARLSLVIREI